MKLSPVVCLCEFLSGTHLWLLSLVLAHCSQTPAPLEFVVEQRRWPTVGTALAECVLSFVAQRTGWSWHRVPLLSQPPFPRCPRVNWHHSTRHRTAASARRAPACELEYWRRLWQSGLSAPNIAYCRAVYTLYSFWFDHGRRFKPPCATVLLCDLTVSEAFTCISLINT